MGNKIIRDVVHGDIYFPEKFIKLIDTPEFQRLNRVKQLSTAYMLFPSAVHTRFSHSIGTYYIMNKLIKHFEGIFKSMDSEINKEEKEVALCAALLHDIGHGPFSHAFEHAFADEIKIDKHEIWSVNIITSESTMINKILRKEFGEKFPEKVASVIKSNFDFIEKGKTPKQLNIFKVISLLISSNLDADRMDYLLRDAYFTGVTNGKYDLDRLIRSLDIDSKDNQICICVNEKYISTLEQYVLARYHMSKEVYLHPIKCEMEVIVKKIFYRLYKLTNNGEEEFINDLPEAFKKLFKNEKINENLYTALDDSVVTDFIVKFARSSDSILATLCDAFLNRYKYQKLNLLNNKKSDLNYFKLELNEMLIKEGKKRISNFNNEYFWIECNIDIEIYTCKKDIHKNILVRKNNGTLVNIINISNVINKNNATFEGKNNDKELEEKVNMRAFINKNIFYEKYGEMSKQLMELVKAFENRNHIEIEKKYLIEDSDVFNKVQCLIEKFDDKYKINCITAEPIEQVDYYYDTKENSLYKANKTLRIRKVENNNLITIKKPVEYEDISNSQRFEYEENIEDESVYANEVFILKHLPELNLLVNKINLINCVVIKNKRKKFNIEKGTVKFEMVFDDVKFFYNKEKENVIKQDYEMEIELKSDYSHRVCLEELTSYLESSLKITSSNESKYKRGMNAIFNN